MKLKNEFVTYTADNKHFMVSTDTKHFSGIVRSNKSAAFIIESLKTETNREQIISQMLSKFDADRDVISADVDIILEKLREIDALEE